MTRSQGGEQHDDGAHLQVATSAAADECALSRAVLTAASSALRRAGGHGPAHRRGLSVGAGIDAGFHLVRVMLLGDREFAAASFLSACAEAARANLCLPYLSHLNF